MTLEPIKRCPCCDGPAGLASYTDSEHPENDPENMWVECSTCGLETMTGPTCVENWNKRP